MGARKNINVTGTDKNTGAATAGGIKSHFQVFESDGTTALSNPTELTTPQTIGAGGMLNVGDADVYAFVGRPTIFTAAVDDTITCAEHGLSNNDVLTVVSSTTLPAGLSAATVYHVINAATDTFKLSLTEGGSAVNITDTGTGVHTLLIPGELPNAVLIAMLDASAYDNANVLKFGEDCAMTNASDIANYAVDAWDSAIAF